jgi:hypothetical protein
VREVFEERDGEEMMTASDRIIPAHTRSSITVLSVAGALCYAIWGCLHIYAGYNVFLLGDLVDPGMVRGRLHQSGWNLFFLRRDRHRRCPDVEHPQQQVGLLD